MEKVFKSILDDDFYEREGSKVIMNSFLKKLNNIYDVDPKSFCDCLGRRLEVGDFVLYSDKDCGPRPGIVVKIDDDGDHCAISYTGNGEDCKNICGEICCNDLVYKCLKIDIDKLMYIIG